MNKVLVVVDMQNDFIDGALANRNAQKIVTKTAKFVSSWEGVIIFTRDTHYDDYLETMEGKHLPIPHCIENTKGWEVNPTILEAARKNKKARLVFLNKNAFGAANSLATAIRTAYSGGEVDEVIMCGTCTDICVISNALGIKSIMTETPIKVIPSLCAGLSIAKHKAALEVMQSCQIEVLSDD